MNKHKKIKIVLFLVIIMFFSAIQVYGAEEPIKKLQDSIATAFKWGLGIASLLAVISFIFGAIQYMLSKVAEGKDRMIGSVLGLGLIFISWMILQTINPKLTELSFESLPEGTGIFYVKDDDTRAPANKLEIDTSNLIELGYKKILYSCISPDNAPKLFVWSYNNTNMEGTSNMHKMECNSAISLTDFKSFEWEFESPGVYFCAGTNCSNSYCSKVVTQSTKNIDLGYTIKSILIVNEWKDRGPGNSSGMIGVVLHDSSDFEGGGSCHGPLVNSSVQDTKYTEKCEVVPSSLAVTVRSADIFYIAKDKKLAGSGIGFYSKSTGWNQSEGAGTFLLTPEKMAKGLTGNILDPKKDVKFEYASPDQKDLYQKSCQNFKECEDQKSMQTNDGNYLVMFVSKSKDGKKSWCQTFTSAVENFGQKSILPQGFADFELTGIWVTATAK